MDGPLVFVDSDLDCLCGPQGSTSWPNDAVSLYTYNYCVQNIQLVADGHDFCWS